MGGSRGGASNRCGSRVGASKRDRRSSKRGVFTGINGFIEGLRDESDEEYQLKMDLDVVYEMEKEEMTHDKEDAVVGRQHMIQDNLLQVADLPTQESSVEGNPKPTKSKKSASSKSKSDEDSLAEQRKV
ncbi:hypothetical protein Tco_0996091 [Tanacetum coccineum]